MFNLEKMLKKITKVRYTGFNTVPRYDTKTQDPIYIKQSLSEFGNSVYDQLWLENGGPKNIKTVSFDNFESFGYLKDIYMGKLMILIIMVSIYVVGQLPAILRIGL